MLPASPSYMQFSVQQNFLKYIVSTKKVYITAYTPLGTGSFLEGKQSVSSASITLNCKVYLQHLGLA
jgi:hypothetical protein